MSQKLKTCFLVCPIGEPGSPTRYHSDTVFECYVEPAIAAVGGFETPVRADHIAKSGIITHHVFEQIAEADLVIADLTGPNANVFYELGVRHTLKKRFVQMITKGQNIPFDVKQLRTIDFEITDLRGAKKVVEDLTAAIRECFKEGFEVQTPLGYSATLQSLDKGDAQAQSLGLILDKLDTLAALQRSAPSLPTGMMAGPFAVTVPHHSPVGVQGPQGPQGPQEPTGYFVTKSLAEMVRNRAEVLLAIKGWTGSAPPEILGEALATIGVEYPRGTASTIDVRDVDTIVGQIIDTRLFRRP